MLKEITIGHYKKIMANQYHSEKLRTSGHSHILTVPKNAISQNVTKYIPYACYDGTIVFKPVK